MDHTLLFDRAYGYAAAAVVLGTALIITRWKAKKPLTGRSRYILLACFFATAGVSIALDAWSVTSFNSAHNTVWLMAASLLAAAYLPIALMVALSFDISRLANEKRSPR